MQSTITETQIEKLIKETMKAHGLHVKGFLKASEIANAFCVSVKSINDLSSKGILPCVRIGSGKLAMKMYERISVEKYLISNSFRDDAADETDE